MNKKYITFGLLGLFAMALVSAGLVGYLSNTTQIVTTVSSPIVIGAFSGDATAFGGETKTISTDLENLADAQIKGKIKVVITNDGISLEDFNTLTADVTEYRPGVAVNVMSDLDMMVAGVGFIESIDESVDNELTFITTERTFEIKETWDASIALGFKANAVGDYNVAVTIIPLA